MEKVNNEINVRAFTMAVMAENCVNILKSLSRQMQIEINTSGKYRPETMREVLLTATMLDDADRTLIELGMPINQFYN